MRALKIEMTRYLTALQSTEGFSGVALVARKDELIFERAAGTAESGVDPEVAHLMAAIADPWPEAHEVDTGGDAAAAVGRALDLVQRG